MDLIIPATPLGTYSDTTGQDECEPCPEGTACPNYAMSAPVRLNGNVSGLVHAAKFC